jgi:predicted lysophospholipase L1 biosynthesis ABC-type transport system permease subunit
MVVLGAVAGLALGMTLSRYVASLLYQVKPTDPIMLAIPAIFILVGASLAAIPAVVHAVRIDPGTMLRQAE